MSRRREAAELARVLQLSTQEARFASHVSPHTLSSPGTTDHSREMEIRPIGPEGAGVDPRLIMRPPTSSGTGGNQSGSGENSSAVQSQQNQNHGGSGDAGGSTIEQNVSTENTSDRSTIQTFTPSGSNPTNQVLVPPSSDMQPPLPRQSAQQTPSSRPSPPHNQYPASSTGKSDAEPHFSPTQGSRKHEAQPRPSVVNDTPATEASPPRPALKHQYSRVPPPAPATSTTKTVAPVAPKSVIQAAGSSSRPYRVSSSPDIAMLEPAAPAKSARRSRPGLDDSDEDVYDPGAKSKSTKSAKKTSVKKVSTGKSGDKLTTPSTTKEVGEQVRKEIEAGPSERNGRRESPDPLLIGPVRGPAKVTSREASTSTSIGAVDTPTNPKKVAVAKTSSKSKDVNKATKDKGKEKQVDQDGMEKEVRKNKEGNGGEPSGRASVRVRDKEAKEALEAARKAAETLERRRKRAEEKEKLERESAIAGAGSEVRDESGKDGARTIREIRRGSRESSGRQTTPAIPAASVSASTPVIQAPKRKRAVSSSPPLGDTIIAVVPQASETPSGPTTSVAESYNQAVRAISVDSVVVVRPAEAGPGKMASPIESTTKKPSATQTKKQTAAAKKKATTAANKAKKVEKTVPKSKEMIEDSEDDEEVEKVQDGKGKEKVVDEEETAIEVPRKPSPSKKSRPTPKSSPEPIPSPPKNATPAPAPVRSPLTAVPSRMTNAGPSTVSRHSPGPMSEKGTPLRPDGIKFKTERNDLASVLSKFPKSRFAGMSRRMTIAPLHSKIGPPKKELPPAPKKAEKRKKGDGEEDEDEDDDDEDDGEEGEDGMPRKKRKKEKGMEWFMVED